MPVDAPWSVIWVSDTPTFEPIGDHLEVGLVSGTKCYRFRMPIALAQVALCRCDQAITDAMQPKPTNVRKFRKKDPPPKHV